MEKLTSGPAMHGENFPGERRLTSADKQKNLASSRMPKNGHRANINKTDNIPIDDKLISTQIIQNRFKINRRSIDQISSS
uniref:Uncharacterized protein n=1 Tax=Romanomermis culicivorax TaxID=13658 RepID=A0A915IIG7_ROMCU